MIYTNTKIKHWHHNATSRQSLSILSYRVWSLPSGAPPSSLRPGVVTAETWQSCDRSHLSPVSPVSPRDTWRDATFQHLNRGENQLLYIICNVHRTCWLFGEDGSCQEVLLLASYACRLHGKCKSLHFNIWMFFVSANIVLRLPLNILQRRKPNFAWSWTSKVVLQTFCMDEMCRTHEVVSYKLCNIESPNKYWYGVNENFLYPEI